MASEDNKKESSIDLTDIIQDKGTPLLRSAVEAVQFGEHPWKKTANSALQWGYGGIQLSSFHLNPKDLAEGTLAEEVHSYLKEMGPAYDGLPFGLAGYSTHCALTAWGFPQHPGSLKFVPAGDSVKAKFFGKPNEQRAWMWDNVVQYIPKATAKLGLMGTHTFIPPAVAGNIEGLEFAGAHIPSYTFVMNTDIPILKNGKFVNIDLWKEGIRKQGEYLEPLFDLCDKAGIYLATEIHWDTIARGPSEFLEARDEMGNKAKKFIYVGLDTSHAWHGENGRDWIDKLGPYVRWLHIKNKVQYNGKPLITGNMDWTKRGMHFGAADEGNFSIGDQLNYVIMNTRFVYHPTYRDEEPVGELNNVKVYRKWAIAEGEHPVMSQVKVAQEYAKALQPLCERTYGSGFKVGGVKG